MSRETIEIHEHKKKHDTKIKEEDLTATDKVILESLEAQNKISKSYGDKPDHFLQLTTYSFIGSINLEGPDVRVNILPKIFKDDKNKWENLYVFLNEAISGELNYFENAKNFYTESSESKFLNPLHLNLIIECENLMKQGLLKSYVIHAENTSSMRGKLLMQHQMLNDAMLRPQFFCEFDELEYDSIENRVILQALTVVERTSDSQEVRMRSMDLAQKLSGLVKKTVVHRPERQRMMQSYNRQNLRYQRIHEICDKVIEESGIKDIYSGDNSYTIPIFYDMNDLFESFVQKLFEKYYVEEDTEVKTQLQEQAWKGDGLGSRGMRPDITMWKNECCLQIIDVKYKTKIIETSDLYQIGFYMHEFGFKNKDKKPIPHGFAITPKFKDAKMGIYKSATGLKVHVKRIDVPSCLELIKTQNFEELKKLVKCWIHPILSKD